MNEDDLNDDFWEKIGRPTILPELPDGWTWSVTPGELVAKGQAPVRPYRLQPGDKPRIHVRSHDKVRNPRFT